MCRMETVEGYVWRAEPMRPSIPDVLKPPLVIGDPVQVAALKNYAGQFDAEDEGMQHYVVWLHLGGIVVFDCEIWRENGDEAIRYARWLFCEGGFLWKSQ